MLLALPFVERRFYGERAKPLFRIKSIKKEQTTVEPHSTIV